MKLLLFDSNYALIVFRKKGLGPLIALCQGSLDLVEDIQNFLKSSGDSYNHFPLATLQRGDSYWAKSLTKHDFYAIEENIETLFAQYISYDQGVVQKWEIRVTGRGDLLYLAVGLVIENFKELHLQAHYPNGRDGPPLEFTLPRWRFIQAYEEALDYLANEGKTS